MNFGATLYFNHYLDINFDVLKEQNLLFRLTLKSYSMISLFKAICSRVQGIININLTIIL